MGGGLRPDASPGGEGSPGVQEAVRTVVPEGAGGARGGLGPDGHLLRLPQAHWKHLRTTNVVESPFASVRLRTSASKRFKRVESATALIWKLLTVAEKQFRRLDAPHLLRDVFEGRKFEDG